MSTSLLYHGFGVRDHSYVRTKYLSGQVIFTIERRAATCRCAACGSETVWREGVVVPAVAYAHTCPDYLR